MNVSNAIEMMREAELKQLAVKDNKIAILGFINLGILELYKRFRLAESEAIINKVYGVTEYSLDGTDVNVTIDLEGKQLVLIEKKSNEASFRMPTYNTVVIPDPEKEEDIEDVIVYYRYAPDFLVHEKQEIPLPPQFFEALFHYVGYRGHSSVRGDAKTENNTHYMRFDKSCNNIIYNGLFIQEEITSAKWENRGFV